MALPPFPMKLVYFDPRGHAEVARQLLVFSAQPYVDEHISLEQWERLRPTTQFGSLPLLFVDSAEVSQPYSILRFLARMFGHAGLCPLQAACIDSFADVYRAFEDAIRPFTDAQLIGDRGTMDSLYEHVVLPAARRFLGQICTDAIHREEPSAGGGPSGFLVGCAVTWVDLLVAEHVHSMRETYPTYCDEYPEVLTHMNMIRSIPQLKKYLARKERNKNGH